MNRYDDRQIARAASVDDRLCDEYEALPGQKADADLAARRIAAWCRSCANGDWSLFEQRLERDGLTIGGVLTKFSSVRRKLNAAAPSWVHDAQWIQAALHSPKGTGCGPSAFDRARPLPFDDLFFPLVVAADATLERGIEARTLNNLGRSARESLRHSLLKQLCTLCAPAIYDRFVKASRPSGKLPEAAKARQPEAVLYISFISEMRTNGLDELFQQKPVLLRLVASITRQWIDAAREFLLRLDADLDDIRRDLLHSSSHARVSTIEGELSDPHNRGRSVQIVGFESGDRVVYKPKDLRVDRAWHSLVCRLNQAECPLELKAARVISRQGYGWTEFIGHTGCSEEEGFKRFFQRAGGWLALFHVFAASDMHQDNMIAAGDHPVPIDLEMILQATSKDLKSQEPEAEAHQAATDTVTDSVLSVGLLPSYSRSPENDVFAVAGLTSNDKTQRAVEWIDINSDAMRPRRSTAESRTPPNLPHVHGVHARFGDYIEEFIWGFSEYSQFLRQQAEELDLFEGFSRLPVRKVIRSTRFYYLLLQRLRDHHTMDDGILWSAQADFLARFSDWDHGSDLIWPLQRAERSALLDLNVPHLTLLSDGHEIRNSTGVSIHTEVTSGLDRAKKRIESFSHDDLAWQIEVIRQSTSAISKSHDAAQPVRSDKAVVRDTIGVAPSDVFQAEADKIALEIGNLAMRRGTGAAWVGLDWLGDSEVSQLAPLDVDLYNGTSGISLFFAAHAAIAKNTTSRDLALAGIQLLRKNLRSRSSARMARGLGAGAALGMGSVVYALCVISKCLDDQAVLDDAAVAAELFTKDLICADKNLDIIGGSAGGILGLLRLYRDTRSGDALSCAVTCGEYLLAQRRMGNAGQRSWLGQGAGSRLLTGMSHGASGFAYALASLSAASGRQDFQDAASECIAFENACFSEERSTSPELRFQTEEFDRGRQWCNGAPGIGLSRIGIERSGSGLDPESLRADIRWALASVERGWPNYVDTLCCGTMGNIEFLCEAGAALDRQDLRGLARERLLSVINAASSSGDYRWSGSKRQFNLGLFRGLAGIGYTCLRQVDASLPSILMWE